MFCPAPENEEIRDWKYQIKQRKTLNKHLENAGKKFFNKHSPDRVSRDVLENLERMLKSADISHTSLIQYIKPFLPDSVILEVFSSEKVKRENDNLKKENAKLKAEKQAQKQRLEQVIKSNNQVYLEEQQKAYKKYAELKSYCGFLENEKDNLKNSKASSSRHTDPLVTLNVESNKINELGYKIKEQRFEETLKTQNILIEELKVRLENSEKQNESLKLLNRDLAKRNNKEIPNEELINKQSNIQFENEKRRTQEYKQQVLEFQQKCEDLERLKHNQEMELNHLKQQLQIISKEKATLQYNILKYETHVKESNKAIDFFKLQNQHLEQQIKQNNSVIQHLNNEIENLKKSQPEKDLHPIPAPRKSDAILTHNKNEVDNKKEGTNESQNEEAEPYVQECLKKIEDIFQDTLKLEKEVDEFFGTKEDKDFYHLQELLIRNILKLDNVETEGYLVIREKRREVIRFVQKVINTLKEKAT